MSKNKKDKKPKPTKIIRRLAQPFKPQQKPVDNKQIITGTIESHRDGFAFFIPDNKDEKDLFIHEKNLSGAMHKDHVAIKVVSFKGKLEGVVVDIIERGVKEILGVVDRVGQITTIIPFSRNFTEIINIKNNTVKVKDGDVVQVKIEKYPTNKKPATGHISDVIGHITDVGIDNKIVMYKHNLTHDFPEQVVAETDVIEAGKFPNRFRSVADYKNMFTVTIDGETAKDYDDAISIEKDGDDFVLYVHIADVTRYVTRGSAIDNEARLRGTSVYFPEFAIPMLPEAISNGVCSLLPNVDRYTVTAKIKFDKEGNKLEKHFYRSKINSNYRLTYTYVNEVLAGTEQPKCEEFRLFLGMAKELADILAARRVKGGGVDFDLPEPTFSFAKDGRVADISPAERGFAERMIEFFMISANEAVAEFLFDGNVPTVYRTHGEPDVRKIEQWVTVARSLSIPVPPIQHPITPNDLRAMSEAVKGAKQSELLNSLLVRSMMRAEYTTTNDGHFGLSSTAYTHFTSPIRRYPDVLVHRALLSKLGLGDISEPMDELMILANTTSTQERAANDAEGEIGVFKKLEYLEMHELDEFEAYINRVGAHGVFIYVEKLMLTGFIDYANLSNETFIVEGGVAVGVNSNRRYRLGDRLSVRLFYLDIMQLRADFEAANMVRKKKKKKK